MKKYNHWNELIKVRETHPTHVKKAEMLLSQLNTATATQKIEKEIEIFLENDCNRPPQFIKDSEQPEGLFPGRINEAFYRGWRYAWSSDHKGYIRRHRQKSDGCSKVLQLMDEDYSYRESLKKVLTENSSINKQELEQELKIYI